MKQEIKYSYCVDEEGKLVHINDITSETRCEHKWYCLQCGQEMIPKCGEKRIKHFSHKAKTACDGETYLHKLAKRKIREKFESADKFMITFVKDVLCNQYEKCLFFQESKCQVKGDPISFNLKDYYGKCFEEVKVEEFRPDLLLTRCSTTSAKDSIFIEVYITHLSEMRKIESGYRIIETTQITSEKDIEDILDNGFVEKVNCFFNFEPRIPQDIRKKGMPITRFILFENGEIKMCRAHEGNIFCDNWDKRIDSDSVYELNINIGEDYTLSESCELGLIYLIKKKGLKDMKSCLICKTREICYEPYIRLCRESSRQLSRQVMAVTCKFYQKAPDKLNHSLSELEKIISEIP